MLLSFYNLITSIFLRRFKKILFHIAFSLYTLHCVKVLMHEAILFLRLRSRLMSNYFFFIYGNIIMLSGYLRMSNWIRIWRSSFIYTFPRQSTVWQIREETHWGRSSLCFCSCLSMDVSLKHTKMSSSCTGFLLRPLSLVSSSISSSR